MFIRLGDWVINESAIAYIEFDGENGEATITLNTTEYRIVDHEYSTYGIVSEKYVIEDPAQLAGLKNWYCSNAIDLINHVYASPDPRLEVSSGVQKEARNKYRRENGIPEEA